MSGKTDPEKSLPEVRWKPFCQRLPAVHWDQRAGRDPPDDRPPTRKQEQLVRKLVKDFPSSKKLGEYYDYETKPTKANASAFITRALEENWPQVQQSDGYMKYIATRPRAERLGDHGLFGDEDGVDLEKAMRELDYYTGNVWTHIISLKREDAARLATTVPMRGGTCSCQPQ